ncbi:MAG: hypothetical protein GX950_03825 [Candidatus Diapherotrites archaeon]|jgi:uncharacterized alpha/beta hydrolase family protein|uniref:Uncharacterized protein n=1 Tax=Candidatus Iainarchaeum sp. TaxID=3101447 RepID=A0A7K4C069_9ARCH|nr:hypothetical protein [Candidatus Diapherotrites archaeon]
MKKIAIGIVLVIIISIGIFLLIQNMSQTEKLKVCPDKLIQNDMPSIMPITNSNYYLINGERKEIIDFDANWVKNNCTIKIEKEI